MPRKVRKDTPGVLHHIIMREIGINNASMVRKIDISTIALKKSVQRGAEIVKHEGYKILKTSVS